MPCLDVFVRILTVSDERYKFIIGFFIIFALSVYVLNFFMSDALYKNNLEIINTDMAHLQKSSREYLKQFFLINKLSGDPFRKDGKYIVQELSRNFEVNVALYDTHGNFLYEGISNLPFM